MQDSNNKQTADVAAPTGELYRFLENEIAYRRGRKQEIFAWASSLMVAIIGGTVALTYWKQTALALPHKILLTVAIFILCGFSCYWIDIHWSVAIAARKRLSFYYDKIAENNKDAFTDQDWPSIAAILALTLASLAAVWINVRPCGV